MKLSDYVKKENILLNLSSTTKKEVLKEFANFAEERELVDNATTVYEGLLAREQLISTGIGDGVAIPHTRCEGPERIFLIIGRSIQGVDFDSLDGEPVHIFMTIVGPESADKDQLKILSRTARFLKQNEFRERIMKAEDPGEIVEALFREEAKV